MRLGPSVAPLQVLAVCRICIVCAVITVGQYLHECVRCVLTILNRGISAGKCVFKADLCLNELNRDTLEWSA